MRDYLDLSPTPVDEPCAQVGPGDYMPRMRAECKAFVNPSLAEPFPKPWPLVLAFALRSNPHDAGAYLSKSKPCFNDEDEAQTEWAYTIENELPQPLGR
jgi:hypothetical protein